MARCDFWLWACINADTKLVLSHRVGKRSWIDDNLFVQDVRERVKGQVQIATDQLPAYAFHIRQHFGYEGYSFGTETKIFGEPQLLDGTLARVGRNEGVRKMVTAEREAVVRLAGSRNVYYEPCRARFLDRSAGIEAFPTERTRLQQRFGNAQARGCPIPWRLQLRAETFDARDAASGCRWRGI